MNKYPAEWPCQLCNKPLDAHVKDYTWDHTMHCFTEKDSKDTRRYGWYWMPMDNLTYVEKMAEVKKL